eukprot:TRINITY_DN1190_c1_g1_i1.p1 TRINITY_DN1190_c1_g1~~TRINITY_DN1190_c1_g1_i1.p1  ORF type:complete len:104 (+),score=4.44 TRINITY_DN1190_c1_g1_i1:499-810(+)
MVFVLTFQALGSLLQFENSLEFFHFFFGVLMFLLFYCFFLLFFQNPMIKCFSLFQFLSSYVATLLVVYSRNSQLNSWLELFDRNYRFCSGPGHIGANLIICFL